MSKPFIPFAKPSLDENEIQEVVATLESGWLATGPKVKQFEAALSEYCQVPYVAALSSATAGLHLALLSLELSPGDEVITTPLTFVATINTIVLAGGIPKLIDIDPQTLGLDLNQLEDAITPKTRAIMPVHFAGLPIDLDKLYAIADKHGCHVIEDCAHACGASYKGAKIGGFPGTQVFSFHPNKNITTGEGGAITTHDQDLLRKIEILRFHGIDRSAWDRDKKSGSAVYDVVAPGLKYNMMDLSAAIGIHQLRKLDKFVQAREQLVRRYYEQLRDFSEFTLPGIPDYAHQHAWHLFTPRLNLDNLTFSRDEFITKMREQDIGIGLHYQAVHLYSYYQKHFDFRPGDFPQAEQVGDSIVSLPLFPDLTEAEQDRVITTMRSLFDACP